MIKLFEQFVKTNVCEDYTVNTGSLSHCDISGNTLDDVNGMPINQIQYISSMIENDTKVHIYWDMSYGILYTSESISNPGQTPIITKLPFTFKNSATTSIKKHELQFDSHNTVPKYIIAQTIATGYDNMHDRNCYSFNIYDTCGRCLIWIYLHGIGDDYLLNWHVTNDHKWIIVWRNDKFQPIIFNMDEINVKLTELDYKYPLRFDRLDWLCVVSPYSVYHIEYKNDKLYVIVNKNIKSSNTNDIYTDDYEIGITRFCKYYDTPLTYNTTFNIDLTTRKLIDVTNDD